MLWVCAHCVLQLRNSIPLSASQLWCFHRNWTVEGETEYCAFRDFCLSSSCLPKMRSPTYSRPVRSPCPSVKHMHEYTQRNTCRGAGGRVCLGSQFEGMIINTSKGTEARASRYGHIMTTNKKQRDEDWYLAQFLIFSFLVSLRPKSMGWYHHIQDNIPQLNLSRNALTNISRDVSPRLL